MARKKAEVTEEVKTVEPADVVSGADVVEEKPKKSRKKKVEEPAAEIPAEPIVVEEPEVAPVVPEVVEEVKADEPVVEEVKVEEVKPEPIKAKKATKAEKVEEAVPVVEEKSTTNRVIAKSNLYVLKKPGMLAYKIGSYKAGTKFEILEEQMGWGKIAEGKWINLNYVEKI